MNETHEIRVTDPVPVVLLPGGNIAYRMDAWWREIGPDGRDRGNLINLPEGAVPMAPVLQGHFSVSDDEIREWAQQVAAGMNQILHELGKERARSTELFRRVDRAENALDDAQRSLRQRVSDWWHRGGIA